MFQAYGDKNHGYLTYAPTVQRVLHRLLLAVCAMDSDIQFFTRDVSQEYVQLDTCTQRQIFVQPPEALNLPLHVQLRVDKPLYGLPDTGRHWYQTCHSHHCEKLSLISAIFDPCFLFTKAVMSIDAVKSSMPCGPACLNTDGTGSCGNDVFFQKKSKMASRFDCKPTNMFSTGKKILFYGVLISLNSKTYKTKMGDHIHKLQNTELRYAGKPAFVTQKQEGPMLQQLKSLT